MAPIRTYTAQPFSQTRTILGEGPVWDHRTNRLSWVDIVKSELHIFDATANKTTIYRVPSHCGVQFLAFAIPCGPTQQPENPSKPLTPGEGASRWGSIGAEGAFTVPAMTACTDTFVCGTEKGLFLWNPIEGDEQPQFLPHNVETEKNSKSALSTSGSNQRKHNVISLSPMFAAAHSVLPQQKALPKHHPNTTHCHHHPQRLLSSCPINNNNNKFNKEEEQQDQVVNGDVALFPVEGVRPNDAKVDAHGRLFYGTMDIAEKQPNGNLFRVTTTSVTDSCTTHSFHAALLASEGKFTICNGIDWSPTYDTMYTIDSPTQRVYVAKYDAERGLSVPGTKRALCKTPENTYPDGMCVDEEGYLWVALWNGGKVLRVCPQTGDIVAEILVPGVKRVTSVCFGGPRLSQLFITTAVGNTVDAVADAGEEAHAGRVFVAHVGACGLPMNAFPIPLRVAVQFCDRFYKEAVLSAKL